MSKAQFAAALVGLMLLLTGQSAAASSLIFSVRDGRVTIVAKDVTVREILVEWERIGRTSITNLDKLKGPRVTLELRDVPEATALAVLLRSVSGYVALPRNTPSSTGSVFRSILILPSSPASAPPAPVTARAPSPGNSVPLPAASPSSPTSGAPVPPKRGAAPRGVVSAGSGQSARFVPLSPAEQAGLRLTRQKQQDVLFGRDNSPPAGSAPPVSTDASRPGTVTTVAPGQNQQSGTRRR